MRQLTLVVLIAGLSATSTLFAQHFSADLSAIQVSTETPAHGPVEINLNESKLLQEIKSAPQRFARDGKAPKEVQLPGLNGGTASFQLERVQTMHPDLQAKYPEIMSFAGWKTDDPTTHVRAEYSPDQGWTISYRPSDAERVAIRPKETVSGRGYERVMFSDVEVQHFSCDNDDEGVELDDEQVSNPDYLAMRAGDCQLRQYRTAIATTGEYSQAVGGATPTVASVLAALNVAVNRLNEVYERDMGITLQLIADNDQIIYFNSATDPFTNGNAGAMIGESQTTIDAVIGNGDYDLGHLFGTGGAGLASLRSVCRAGSKASGITGIGNPTGDFFYIDYVAHEIGHQFGATHTFYNSCSGNRTSSTAVEPGSGSTIMAYAGICTPNVQNRSDDVFHSVSLQQMSDFVTGSTHTCPVILDSSNDAPSVTIPQSTFTIPVSTTFELIADATDPDGTSLTYTWEQIDIELGGNMPPEATNTVGPLFRALNVTPDPRRRFPSGNFPTYEVLPSVERDMDFRVTVRDNDSRYGCTSEADVRVTTSGSTPFRISNYNTSETFEGLASYTLLWDVAETDVAPINTPLVDIFLSLDGGLTYDFALAEMVPNNGSAVITLPNINTTTARFVVKGHDNVFLDVNDANHTIEEPAVPTFSITAPQTNGASCAGADASYTLEIGSVLGFSESVTLSTTNLPAGATASFTNNGGSGMFTSVMTISGLANVSVGTYSFEAVGMASGQQRTLAFVLDVNQVPSESVTQLFPADGGDEGVVFTTFSWDYDATKGSVRFELSGDPTFQAGTFSQLFDQAEINASGVAAGVYYWRVSYENECGRGPWSELRSFRKIPLDEETFVSTSPVTIGAGGPATYSSTINVPRQGDVYQVEFATEITHSYIGDLDADVEFPAGLGIELFAQPSGGTCTGQNIQSIFADDAPNTALDFVGTCGNGIPSNSGIFQPIDLAFTSLPREGSGNYTINVSDNANADGGAITEWDVTLWYADIPEFNESQTINTVQVFLGGSANVSNNNLAITAAGLATNQTIFVVKTLPTEGSLALDGATLGLGEFFSQADIDNNDVTYVHSASTTSGADAFTVDVILPNTGFIPNLNIPVSISMNNLTLTGAVTGTILCNGDETASIAVNVTGGTQPYEYRLDNGPFQSSSNFTGLGAGTYSVTVRDADQLEFTLNSLVVTEPDVLILDATAVGSSIQAEGDGGTSPYTYSLDNSPFQSSGTFSGLADASYEVTVKDANDCETSQNVIVANSNLSVTLEVELEILCHGDLGILFAAASDGVAPYSYSLNGGPSQSSDVFTNLGEGTYRVVVTDALGNRANSTAVFLVEPEVLSATATSASNTITVDVMGGTPGYTYSLDGGAPSTDNVFVGLSNGSYSILVEDANRCSTIVQATVNVNQLAVSLQLVAPITCNGSEDAILRANAAGGPAPYSYRLNNGPAQSDAQFDDIGPGMYTVVVTDADGNSATSSTITVTEPTALFVVADVDQDVITATPSGGTSPYEYSLTGNNFQSSNVFDGLANGTYTVTIRDANDCLSTTTATVSVADPLAIGVTFNLGQESCPGAADGAVTLTASNGTSPYEYSIDGVNFQAGSFFDNLAAGSYTATVRDASQATASATFDILPRQIPTIDVAVEGSRVTISNFQPTTSGVEYSFDGGTTFSSTPFGYYYTAGDQAVIIRYGACQFTETVSITNPLMLTATDVIVCADGSMTPSSVCASGGSSSINVGTSAGTITPQANANCPNGDGYVVFPPTGVSTFDVIATDDVGATVSVNVSVMTAPAFTVGGSFVGSTLSVTVNGGTAPFTYSLDGGATTQNDPVFENVTGSNVTVTVTDAFGCSVDESFMVSSTGDLSEEFGLQVFPNPMHDWLQVRVNADVSIDRLSIIDATGRIVLVDDSPNNLRLDVSHIAPGFFTLVVESPEGRAHVRLVRQ